MSENEPGEGGRQRGAAPIDPKRADGADLATHTTPSRWGVEGASGQSSIEALEPGIRIGPYEIVEPIGAGASGRVYRAHDPRLARDVALKVLSIPPGGSQDYPRRLSLEGQALAKLTHPNVVKVYDTGVFAGAVFVAMELVQGQSLRDWLAASHPRTEVLEVLIAAGRGLAAAHAAGLAHGDFKPANVMVSRDRRVRIVDFGLARAIDPDGGALAAADLEAPLAFTASLTSGGTSVSGRLRGTPGFIAPELLRGEPAIEALCDQYSFAVTAFVALSGQKPYAAPTLGEYRAAVLRGARAGWPRSVPGGLRRVVERGLAERPAARYPSVHAMVEALERASLPRRRQIGRAAVPLALLLLAGGALALGSRGLPARCEVDPGAFAGVWDSEQRAALERVLRAAPGGEGVHVFSRLVTRFDAFRTEWLEMRREACESALVRGEQPERLFAARNACLDRKLAGAKALIAAFVDPEAPNLTRAAAAMPDSIAECADVAALMGQVERLPEDPDTRARIREIESGFSVVRALLIAERPAKALAFELLDKARGTGHQRTIAEALTWAARATNSAATSSEDRKKGEALSLEGMQLASQVNDEQLFARTASYLFAILAYRERRTDEAATMLPMVDAAVRRAGDAPEQRLEVLIGEGAILMQRGDLQGAIRPFELAVTLSEKADNIYKAYGALARGQLGQAYLQLRRYPDAVRSMQAELEGIQKDLGPRHPRLITSLVNLGLAQAKAGSRDAAWASAKALRELLNEIVPADDWRVATVQFLEGSIWEESGDCARALPLYREAFERVRRFFGPDQANTADLHERLGICLKNVGQADAAIEQLERALFIRRNLKSAPNAIAATAFALADASWSKQDGAARTRALALGEEALSLWRRAGVSASIAEVERWLAARRPAPRAPGATAGAANL